MLDILRKIFIWIIVDLDNLFTECATLNILEKMAAGSVLLTDVLWSQGKDPQVEKS